MKVIIKQSGENTLFSDLDVGDFFVWRLTKENSPTDCIGHAHFGVKLSDTRWLRFDDYSCDVALNNDGRQDVFRLIFEPGESTLVFSTPE